ncbi:MAG: hypothetical protein NVV72_19750 [Asticcacaulis sp.]|nr:hypothetical protein [Asticcacaulis sp.]
MISSSRLPLVLLLLSLACASLSACGNTRSPPEDVVKNPASGMAFARATLGKMPDAARQAFRDKLKAENERLGAELKTILTSGESGQLGRLAVFAQARKANLQELTRRISIENGLLAQIDPEHVNYSGTDPNSALSHAQEITTHRTVIAQAVLMAGVEQRYLRRVLSVSPVLREASQRQDDAQGSATAPSANVGTIPYYIDEMRKEPCLFISPDATPPAPISLRGIELGMNRRKVIDTLCASENGEVRIQVQAVGQTYTPGSVEIGARLLAWEAYRKGAAYSLDYLGVNAWLANPENSAEIRSLVRPYLKTTRFCLHCTGTGHEDENLLSVEYAPEGTVAAIIHARRFTDTASPDANGSAPLVDRASPQPMNVVLDPLRNQFGTPSFVFRNMVAWVYPDGQTPLQPEAWSTQPSPDGLTTGVRLNDANFTVATPLEAGTPAFMTIYKALSARPTPATYCVSKYAYDGLDSAWPLKAIYADRYGARPYDPSAAAPGETDHCGVVVYAVMDVTANDRRDIYVTDSTPVYGLTVTIINTTRLADVHKREAQTVIDRMKALAATAQSAKPVDLRH